MFELRIHIFIQEISHKISVFVGYFEKAECLVTLPNNQSKIKVGSCGYYVRYCWLLTHYWLPEHENSDFVWAQGIR